MSADGRPRGYLAECYWPGVSAGKLAAAVARAEQAADELRGHGRSLHFLGSILVPADETVFWLFDGEKADVRAVSEKAGVPFERILESLRIGGGTHTKQEMTVLPRATAAPQPRPAAMPAGNAANAEKPPGDLRPQRYQAPNCRMPF